MTEEDEALAAMMVEAFFDDPFYQALTSDDSGEFHRKRRLELYFRAAMQEAEDVGETVRDGCRGAALWVTSSNGDHLAAAQCSRNAKIEELLGPAGYLRYCRIVGSFPGNPNFDGLQWSLSILAVAPRLHGQGHGRQLMRGSLVRADAIGAACKLETFNPASLPFYHRLGFEPVAAFTEAFTGARVWSLRRLPVGKI